MVVVTMTCYVGPSNIVGCTLGNVFDIGCLIGTKDGCMRGLGMPRKPCEKRHSKFCKELRYEEPHVCGSRATIGVVPCSPLAFQLHGPMPHCPPPQFWA